MEGAEISKGRKPTDRNSQGRGKASAVYLLLQSCLNPGMLPEFGSRFTVFREALEQGQQ